MNFFKSLFITSYLTIAMIITGYAGWRLYHGGNSIAWDGVILTTGPILLMISRLMMFRNMARTNAHLPLLSGLAIVGTILAVREWVNHTTGQSAPILAIAGLAGILTYIYWYSHLDRKANIRVGEPLPDFTVTDVNNVTVDVKQSGRPYSRTGKPEWTAPGYADIGL